MSVPVSMDCFQNKSVDRASMNRIMKQPPQCMSFTLTFSRLGKTFNYCKMIGSHARWWNDLAHRGDFIPFHRVGNNARGVSLWWNYLLLSPLRFMQKVQFYWYDALINMHDILVKPPLRPALGTSLRISRFNRMIRHTTILYIGFQCQAIFSAILSISRYVACETKMRHPQKRRV